VVGPICTTTVRKQIINEKKLEKNGMHRSKSKTPQAKNTARKI
jgi:hypothetical protein